ncbi:glycosyltransferase family 1 protein [Lutibacter sp.]|uniref:glycosyltransferase family 4 protein n=1 Tax=Lutibacter sp. TaxID=1925666 RepID=UPI001A25EF98|nr:glycosyltransferase family 1 protein [Lutibacter sp.]MBI9042010.1 glycosyltransferase family 4 protein [Lutibacter sp.]
MKKVLIDNQVYENQKFGGISRYFNELKLGNDTIQEMELFVSDNSNKNQINKRIQRKLARVIFNQPQIKFGKNDFYISQIKNLQYNIFHPTYYDNYFLAHLKKPFVLTVHDMIHEKYAEYFGNSFDSINKRRLCEKAAKIIAISNTTKKDLVDIFNIPKEKIEVIYHATNYDSIAEDKPDIDFQGMRYLLFTGNRSFYKNFLTFLIAVSPILKQYKDLQLICTGPVFNSVEMRWIKDLGIGDKVKSFFCESDNELVYLYKNAECFVFPSLYEGFGFPILEAFACNCPLVSSNGGSLMEIAGDAAVYFDPKNIKEMRESIHDVITDFSLKKELIEAGKIRLKDFSWDKCRTETNLLYNKV